MIDAAAMSFSFVSVIAIALRLIKVWFNDYETFT